MRLKIDAIYHNKTNRQGKPYVTKDGRPYELCTIKSNNIYYYGFGSATTKEWRVGDEVEVEVKQINGFNRFTLPPKGISRKEFDELVERINQLEMQVKIVADELIAREAGEDNTSVPDVDIGPEPEIE